MTAPTTHHVKSAVIKVDDATGSLTALTATSKSFGHESKVQTSDDTTISDRAESHTVGIIDNGTTTIAAPYSTTQFRAMAAVYGQAASVTIEQDWGGTATGTRKGTAETFESGFEMEWGVSDTVMLANEFTLSGAVTYADN